MVEICKSCRHSEVCSHKANLEEFDVLLQGQITDNQTDVYTAKVVYVCKAIDKKRERKGK